MSEQAELSEPDAVKEDMHDGSPSRGASWLDGYAQMAPAGDLYLTAPPRMSGRWAGMIAQLSALGQGDGAALAEKVERQVVDLGMAFRLTGEQDERQWPLSPVPILLGAEEWAGIEQGLIQRATLLEGVIADIYGPQRLVSEGHLPAAAITGSPNFWRNMIGVPPPGGRYLHFYAADLGRGPNGEWRVLADRARTPVGVGYALENRLALARSTGDLLSRLNVRRLAPFFSDFRDGLAADCVRVEPRIGLLTPGRFNQSHAEQAHLARYLGFLLVEGEDLCVSEGELYVRTIQGLKRIDGLWRWMDSRFIDPLVFDGQSTIGVPDLFDACARGRLMVGNWPGAGAIESRALAAFLPRLSRAVLGEGLLLPNVATWWCGQEAERDFVIESFDDMVIGSAFGESVAGLKNKYSAPVSGLNAAEREALLAAMARRPMDYVGQEVVRLSTTPALSDGRVTPHPFTLRVFVARDGPGGWKVMPGAFARLASHGDIRAALMGEGDMSADVGIVDESPGPVETLLPNTANLPIRRVAGMLPSKAADNLFWLGRYLERAEMTMRVIRALLGGSIEMSGGSAQASPSASRLMDLLVAWGAAPGGSRNPGIEEICATALCDAGRAGSVHALMRTARGIGNGLRDRLSVDVSRLLRLRFPPVRYPMAETLMEVSTAVGDRLSALAGLGAENMGRTDGWRFHDMGRRIERAINGCRVANRFARDDATPDDLTVLLDLSDCQISYRTRYLAGLSLAAVRDMVLLEGQNPRSVSFQLSQLAEHLRALPSSRNDGMPEVPAQLAGTLVAMVAPLTGESIAFPVVAEIEARLLALSDAIGHRYFLQSRKANRDVGPDLLA